MKSTLQPRVRKIYDEVVAIRRHLHRFPELSFKEFETSKFVQAKLSEWGIDFENNWAGTGVVALIENDPGKKWIALRADLDALPITEANEISYCSENTGVMHACGHDVHTSILLATAKILSDFKNELPVNLKLIFQPGEEKLPGGASLLIEQGVLKNPDVTGIYGLHVFPEMECGKVGLKSGTYMASSDEIYVNFQGKGGHAAMPSQYVNPLMIASRFLLDVQETIAKQKPLDVPTVLAFGKIEGLGATNVIPDCVRLEGTFRTLDEKWRGQAHDIVRSVAAAASKEFGGSADVNIISGYPVLVNDLNQTEAARAKLTQWFGSENVCDLPVRMTAEDFARYSHHVPATFIRIGVRNEEKGIVHPVHNAKFDIDERALITGIETYLSLIFN